MSTFSKIIATLGPIGYLPAPGTCATALTLVLVYAINAWYIEPSEYAILILGTSIFAWHVIVRSLDFFRNHDPSEIVIDEVVGCLIVFFMIPLTIKTVAMGFILFRLFDIAKPFGIRKLEQTGGAWGIVLDDIGAGLLSNLAMQLLLTLDVI